MAQSGAATDGVRASGEQSFDITTERSMEETSATADSSIEKYPSREERKRTFPLSHLDDSTPSWGNSPVHKIVSVSRERSSPHAVKEPETSHPISPEFKNSSSSSLHSVEMSKTIENVSPHSAETDSLHLDQELLFHHLQADSENSGLNSSENCPESLTSVQSSSVTEIPPYSTNSASYARLEEGTSRSPRSAARETTTGLWVFGYGSLCWHQGFQHSDSLTGFVMGYSRRFWQGNVTHRGTEGKPGRVATLVEEPEGIVWGQAFKVEGEAALPYLNNRECELGGYRTTLGTFHPRDRSISPFPTMLYVATPNNRHWLGDDPLSSIADQIVESEGASGHNVEYLLKLADFVREAVPEAHDEHLFGLEALVRDRVESRKLCLRTLMGEKPAQAPVAGRYAVVAAAPQQQHNQEPMPSTSAQFSNRVPTKKLRCVNI